MGHPFTTSIVYERPEDAERQYRPDELRELKIGDRVIFNSTEMEDRYATYDGIVVAVHDTYITLSIRIRPETTIAGVLNTPLPYNYSVEYFEVGRTCYIWKPVDVGVTDYLDKPLKEARNEY